MAMENSYSKEEVYARLLRNAGEMWGLHPSELEGIDPLVRLLLGAMAKEIEKVGNDLHSADARIFRRIAQYLLPDAKLFAQPGHAVVQFEPDGQQEVQRYDELTFEKIWKNAENLNKQESQDIGFSAVGTYRLDGARIAYRVQGNELHSVERLRTTVLAALDTPIAHGEVYLGLRDVPEKPESLSLYFDWRNDPHRDKHLRSLHKITASDANGRLLTVLPGLGIDEPAAGLRNLGDPIAELERRVRSYYDERFLRVDPYGTLPQGSPNLIANALAKAPIAKRDEVRWVRLLFPSDFEERHVHDAVILDSCVPVVNRKLQKAIFRLHKDLNIKRLELDGYYLGIEKAESSAGLRYAEVPSMEMVDVSAGSYSMRFGAAGRFDQRDGAQFLNHMLDLLKDETRSFGAMDLSATVSDLRTIEQALEKVRKTVRKNQVRSNQPYITIKPFGTAENAHVFCWSTDGESANNITAGSALKCRTPGLTGPKATSPVLFVSTTIDGKNELSATEKVQLYKSLVLSRGVIVTKRDMIEHSKYLGGSDLEDVSVEEGVMVSPEHAQGLVRCIEVRLKFAPQRSDPANVERVRKRISADLSGSSVSSLPIRVI